MITAAVRATMISIFMLLSAVSVSAYADGEMSIDRGGPPPRRPPGPPPHRPPPHRPPPNYTYWRSSGTACGPYQPWGTSLQCPSANPNGWSCQGVQPGTKCFGASYWDPNFMCTDPYTGRNQWGSYIFQMYTCW